MAVKKNFKPISWREYEYEYREKTNEWYIALGIVIFGVMVASVVLGNYMFAVLSVVAGFAIGVHAGKHPELLDYEINNIGVRAGARLYPFDTISSHWVDDEGKRHKLFIESKRALLPIIIMPMDEEKTESVKKTLAGIIPEKRQSLSAGHQILEYFGF